MQSETLGGFDISTGIKVSQIGHAKAAKACVAMFATIQHRRQAKFFGILDQSSNLSWEIYQLRSMERPYSLSFCFSFVVSFEVCNLV